MEIIQDDQGFLEDVGYCAPPISADIRQYLHSSTIVGRQPKPAPIITHPDDDAFFDDSMFADESGEASFVIDDECVPDIPSDMDAYFSEAADAGVSDGSYRQHVELSVVEEAADDAPCLNDDFRKNLLDGLNGRQSDAVSLPVDAGPVMVLAGAGSGKTAVLTKRVAWLVSHGVSPKSILAVTFTNKAAREMEGRLRKLGIGQPQMGTFHQVGLRVIKMYPEIIGVRPGFSISDSHDSKQMWRNLFVVPDKDGVKSGELKFIKSDKELWSQYESEMFKIKDCGVRSSSGLKSCENDAIDPHTLGRILDAYEAERKRCNKVDFADMIAGSLLAIRENPAAQQWAAGISHVLIDEFQDTSDLQFDWATSILGQKNLRQNLFLVGDDCQCLVAGTPITMSSGLKLPIESVKVGDKVKTCLGKDRFSDSIVERVYMKKKDGYFVKITTESGKELISTQEHSHFADFIEDRTLSRVCEQKHHIVYLMKKGEWFRIGTTQIYSKHNPGNSMHGVRVRLNQEGGDCAWVLGHFKTEEDARIAEITYSLKYCIPTIVFNKRVSKKNKPNHSIIASDAAISKLFNQIDSKSGALQLLNNTGYFVDSPHFNTKCRNSGRRNISITICGDTRNAAYDNKCVMHRISVSGSDECDATRLSNAGYSVRVAKKNKGWRYETSFCSYSKVEEIAKDISGILDSLIVRKISTTHGSSLRMMPASCILPGMVMYNENGEYEIVKSIDRFTGKCFVYDIDVKNTHNFIANGIVTHNSIYAFRGAKVANIDKFITRYGARQVLLEQNYRCGSKILDAANSLIKNNKGGDRKKLWTENGAGEVLVRDFYRDNEEAEWIAADIRAVPGQDIAILLRTKAAMIPIARALREKQITHHVVGATDFFKTKEIRNALALLRLVVNPMDVISFARAAEIFDGVGKKAVLDAVKKADALGTPPLDVARESKKLMPVALLYEGCATDDPAQAVAIRLINDSGLMSQCGADGEENRLRNIKEFIEIAGQFKTVGVFMEEITLFAESAGDCEGVTLSTVHAAKGLEWDKVYLPAVCDGHLPMANNEDGGEEEERRLMYVAITRARTSLKVSFSRRRMVNGEIKDAKQSRFIAEMRG